MALTRITKGVIKPNENYDTHNINSTGIVTAIGLDVNGNGDISGNLSVGGVLTYEDVTSIDSVGIITAQKDIHVGAGVSAVGVGTFGSLDISGDIDVDGHTNLDNVNIVGVTTTTGNLHFPHANQSDANDGRIGSGTFGEGLNIVGTQTVSGNGRKIRTFGSIIPGQGGADLGTSALDATRFQFGYFNGLKVRDNVGNGLHVGDSADLKLYHNSGNSFIENSTGYLLVNSSGGDTVIRSNNDVYLQPASGEHAVKATANGSVDLYYDQNNHTTAKLRTSATGVTIDGTAVAGGLDISGDIDVDGHTNLDNVSIAGVTTITSSANAALYVAGRSVFGNDTLLPTFGAGTLAVVSNLSGNNNWVDLSILGGRSGRSMIKFGDHDDQDAGAIKYYHTDNSLNFTTNGSSTERLIIKSTGDVEITNDLDVDGHTNLDNVSVAGVTTFAQKINLSDNFIRNCRGFNSGNEQARIVVKAGDNSAGGGLRIVEYYNDDTTLFSSEIANFYTSGIELKEDTTVSGNLTITENIVHSGDTDTKIVFTDNQIDLQTGSSSRIYANNYGVYVKSGFPLAFLSSSGPTPNIKSGGTNAQDLLFTTGSGNPTRMTILSGGSVSIGNNPTVHSDTIFHVEKSSGETNVKFEGNDTMGARLSLHNNSTSGSAKNQIDFCDAGGQSTSSIQGFNTDQTNNHGELVFATRNTQGTPPEERMRISKDGYVGVKETSPQRYFHVTGNASYGAAHFGVFGTNAGNAYIGNTPVVTISTDGNANAGTNDEKALFQVGRGGGGAGAAAVTKDLFRVNLGGSVQIGGVVSNNSDIDVHNTKLTIKQTANNKEDGIYLERSGERRGWYMFVGGNGNYNDAFCLTTNQMGTDTDVLAIDRGNRLAKLGGDVIIDSTNNGYGGLRIYDDSSGGYNVNYVGGRSDGNMSHVFKSGGRSQNQTPWVDATGSEIMRVSLSNGLQLQGDTDSALQYHTGDHYKFKTGGKDAIHVDNRRVATIAKLTTKAQCFSSCTTKWANSRSVMKFYMDFYTGNSSATYHFMRLISQPDWSFDDIVIRQVRYQYHPASGDHATRRYYTWYGGHYEQIINYNQKDGGSGTSAESWIIKRDNFGPSGSFKIHDAANGGYYRDAWGSDYAISLGNYIGVRLEITVYNTTGVYDTSRFATASDFYPAAYGGQATQSAADSWGGPRGVWFNTTSNGTGTGTAPVLRMHDNAATGWSTGTSFFDTSA